MAGELLNLHFSMAQYFLLLIILLIELIKYLASSTNNEINKLKSAIEKNKSNGYSK